MSLFERQIAEEKLATPTPPAVEPSSEQAGGTLVINGGNLKLKERPHKDWRHVIQANHELRNRVHTLLYTDMTEGNTLELDLSHASHVVRGPAVPLSGTIALSVKLPGGVPEDQGIMVDGVVKTRDRVHVIDVQIYYPQATTVTLSDAFVFGRSKTKGESWVRSDFALLLGEENPVVTGLTLTLGEETTMPDLVRRTVDVTLAEELAEGPRPAESTDYFRVSYNERTGKALIIPRALGVIGDQDPAVDPDAPTTEPDTEPTVPPEDQLSPNDPKATPGPKLPRPDTELDYTDENGNPLEPEPMPEGRGSVFALHSNGFSWSEDGGRTWDLRLLQVTATLVDMAVVSTGIYLLDSDGNVWRCDAPRGALNQVPLDSAVGSTERDVSIVNGDFELGNLDGWTHVDGDEPRVLDTNSPAQREGSTYYLTRDWRIINPQPFTLRQTVEVPENGGTARVVGDCWAAPGSTGILRAIANPFIAGPTRGFDIWQDISPAPDLVFFDWARDQNDGQLDLHLVSGSPLGFRPSIQPDGSLSLSEIGPPGTRVFAARNADGEVHPGPVFFPVLTNTGTASTSSIRVPAADVLAIYNFIEGSSWVPPAPVGGFYEFSGSTVFLGLVMRTGLLEVDFLTSGFRIMLTERAEWMTAPEQTYEDRNDGTGQWRELKVEFPAYGDTFDVELEGTGSPVDVFFDNISAGATLTQNDPGVGAMAPARQRIAGGGIDFYAGNQIIGLRAQQTAEQNLASIESHEGASGFYASTSSALVAAGPADPVRIAADTAGTAVFTQSPDGTWTESNPATGSVVGVTAEPIAAVLGSNGNVWTYQAGAGMGGTPIATADTANDMAPDFLRSGLAVTIGAGAVYFVTAGGADAWARQPANATAANRRTCALDSGRYIGHNFNGYDLFYTLQPNIANTWKVAGRLERPIVKMVEMR